LVEWISYSEFTSNTGARTEGGRRKQQEGELQLKR
jgi:hypothetical protein